MLKVKEVVSDNNFIFKYIADSSLTDLWNSTTGAMLDTMFLNQHSANREVTEWVNALATANDDNKLSAANIAMLANMIWAKYSRAWTQYFDYLESEYNPITNYDMVEVETPDITRSIESSQTSDVTTTNSRNTFNSATMVDTDSSNTSGDAESNSQSSEETETGTRTLTRSGNIGVTTTGQILDIDSKFWSNWNYIDSMFKDVDKFITNGIY